MERQPFVNIDQTVKQPAHRNLAENCCKFFTFEWNWNFFVWAVLYVWKVLYKYLLFFLLLLLTFLCFVFADNFRIGVVSCGCCRGPVFFFGGIRFSSVFLLYRESTHSPALTLWGLCLLPAAVTHCNHREQRPLGYIIIMELFVNFTKGLKLPFLNHNCELEN